MFNNTFYNISDNIKINLIDIQDLNSNLIKWLDDFFVKICEWDSWTDIKIVKLRLKKYLDDKIWKTLELWSISELFIHLFLNQLWYKQECTYFNLEENSIKKWFDWYYSFDSEEWIMESKSWKSSSQKWTHEDKIKEWYDDLSKKVSWKSVNNPWNNAYNHASNINVNTNKTIRENIKKFSDNYFNKIYCSIWDFNIIPASTIFLEWAWVDINKDELKNKVLWVVDKFSFKKIIVICITKKSVDLIYSYLDL